MFDGTSDTLAPNLASEATTPNLSIIIPDNCSDGHDAVCAGNTAATNNLSGMTATAATNTAEGTPANQVGGSYASDLFLEKVIPEIQASQAYQDGSGMIDVVWDESYPQFTFSGDSFVDSTTTTASAATAVAGDTAGETLFGKSLNWEPSGPNVPNVVSQAGQQMAAGPGYNEYLDRPSSSSGSLTACNGGTSANGFSTMATGSCYLGGGSSEAGAGLTSYGANSAIIGTAGTNRPRDPDSG